MKHINVKWLAVMFSCFFVIPYSWADEAKVLAKINDGQLTEQDVAAHFQAKLGENAPIPEGLERTQVLNALINREIIVQQAMEEGLDKQPQTQAELKETRLDVLANALMAKWLQSNAPNETEVKQEYERQAALPAPQQFKTRHILTQMRQQADMVIMALNQGKDFKQLATQYSMDMTTKAKGGELDWLFPIQMFPSYAQTVLFMQPGSYTPMPVQTPAGWHVILLEGVRNAPKPKFEEAKPIITLQIQQMRWNQYVASLRQKAKVELVNR